MSGLRRGELLALRWRDIDFAGRRVHVRRAWSLAAKVEKSPKSGKVRSVQLVAELVGPLDPAKPARAHRRRRSRVLLVCTASFEGPGELDLSDARGPTLEVVTIDDGPPVTVRVDGKDAKLAEDEPRRVAGYRVTLTDVDGENVRLRIVGK